MKIRKYKEKDLEAVIDLFRNTVKSINSKDYNDEEINAWIEASKEKETWNQTFLKYFTLVAIKDDKIVGFINLDKTGYLDRLYVHKDYQKQGIATSLCDLIEKEVRSNGIYAFVSITARPFFEKRGYQVIKDNIAQRQGVKIKNYLMYKELSKDNV